VKKSRKPKKTSRKPVKKSRKPVKKSRKPKKTSRPNKKQPKKVRKYMMKRPRTDDDPQDGKRVKREYKLATWELITRKIRDLLTIERKTGYKIAHSHRLNHINNPVVVGVKFVYGVRGGGFGLKQGHWKLGRTPISVGICEMNISLGEDRVPSFMITKGSYGNLGNTSLVENKKIYNVEITTKLITERVKTALRI
jgi:hypothetical protein